jgi:mycofactocin system glycosyltransferase
VSLGSGAARNTGWRQTTAAIVLFLDADVVTDGMWIPDAVPLLLNQNVAALAPRVRSIPNPSRAGRWEQVRPALDLGTNRSVVRPRTRVPYVPTAALLVKREALESVGGFDAAMPLGEDVDLVWRLHDQGWTVRYEPHLAVGHRPRPTTRAWIRQRMTYGRSNVALSVAHPAHVAGIELTWWNVAPLLILARSRPLKAVGFVAGSAGVLMLRDRLIGRCEQPGVMALRLQRDGIAYTAVAVTQAARRNYWPLTLLASVLNRRSRWLLALSLLAPSWEWLRRRPALPIWEWTAASIADDVSFGTGLWLESIGTRTLRAVRVQMSPVERFVPNDVPGVNRQ